MSVLSILGVGAPVAASPLDIFTLLASPIDWALTHLTTTRRDYSITRAIGPFGLAVIIVTLAIRALLFPLFGWQLRTQRRIQAEQRLVAPQLQEIRKKFKRDPKKMQEETMKVYREHGISPFSGLTGCLPLLVQLPIIYSLYNGIRSATNDLPHSDLGFLWISDVSKSPSDAGGFSHPSALIIPLLAALATVVQSKMMVQPPRPNMSDQERTMYNTSKNLVYLAPVMVFIFGLNLPQGLALYWLTQSAVMIIQQWYLVGWGGLPVPRWFPGAGRVTKLSFSQPPETTRGSGKSTAASGRTGARTVPGARGKDERQPAAKPKPDEQPARAGSQTGRPAAVPGNRRRRVPAQSQGGSRRRRGR
jgi:YidC/Oxa1 family membrane protein insertase